MTTPAQPTAAERKAAQAARQLVETYQALAAITAQAIHWMGDKAALITAAAKRLETGLDNSETARAALQTDLETVAQNARLIVQARETLLGPARGQHLRPAMLADVVQAAAFFSGVPEEIFSLNPAPDTPLVRADTTQLARVLGYLFQNALEAGAKHISANITPTLDREHVAVSIADDGEGIAPEVRENMWRAFFTTKGEEHTGLGLVATLLTLAQMNGRITVDSQPGQGATFTIVLPAAEDDEAVDLSHAPEHVFFVDEADDAWALFAANVLKLAGKDVAVEESTAAAANADVILVDEALTTMPVDEVLAQLKEAGVVHKAVVVTAALDPARAERYMQQGVRDVALKPYTYRGLAAFFLNLAPAGENVSQ